MQSLLPDSLQLLQTGSSFIKTSIYDPTTIYLDDTPFDRDAFKKLKKEGYLELSSEDRVEKRYALSTKGKQLLSKAST